MNKWMNTWIKWLSFLGPHYLLFHVHFIQSIYSSWSGEIISVSFLPFAIEHLKSISLALGKFMVLSQHIIPKDRECFLWNTSQHFPSLQSPEIFPSLISSQLKEIQREKETRKETWVTSLDPCGWECISVCVWSLWGLRVEVVYGLCKSKNSQGSGNF